METITTSPYNATNGFEAGSFIQASGVYTEDTLFLRIYGNCKITAVHTGLETLIARGVDKTEKAETIWDCNFNCIRYKTKGQVEKVNVTIPIVVNGSYTYETAIKELAKVREMIAIFFGSHRIYELNKSSLEFLSSRATFTEKFKERYEYLGGNGKSMKGVFRKLRKEKSHDVCENLAMIYVSHPVKLNSDGYTRFTKGLFTVCPFEDAEYSRWESAYLKSVLPSNSAGHGESDRLVEYGNVMLMVKRELDSKVRGMNEQAVNILLNKFNQLPLNKVLVSEAGCKQVAVGKYGSVFIKKNQYGYFIIHPLFISYINVKDGKVITLYSHKADTVDDVVKVYLGLFGKGFGKMKFQVVKNWLERIYDGRRKIDTTNLEKELVVFR